MKPLRFVEVEWNDAHGTGSVTFDPSLHHKPCVMFTRGWLVKEDDTGVSVACERYQEEGQWCYRGSTFVPAGMVVKVRTTR
jgi:hypothetical protein